MNKVNKMMEEFAIEHQWGWYILQIMEKMMASKISELYFCLNRDIETTIF